MDQGLVNNPVLLVEDHPDDAFLAVHTLRKSRITNVVVSHQAEEALEYLLDRGADQDLAPVLLPRFILLDLGLPRMDGFEFLEVVRKNERTSKIPVFILSSSDQPKDIDRCTDLGVTGYLNKPLDGEQLTRVMETLQGNRGVS